jgi:hypothetical protein
MTDRAFLFLAALVGESFALGAAIWLMAAGQLGTFDGNFLFLSALVVAAAFGLYLKFMIARAMEARPAPKPAAAPAEKKTQAHSAELAGKV